jgi:hypothetical protein
MKFKIDGIQTLPESFFAFEFNAETGEDADYQLLRSRWIGELPGMPPIEQEFFTVLRYRRSGAFRPVARTRLARHLAASVPLMLWGEMLRRVFLLRFCSA